MKNQEITLTDSSAIAQQTLMLRVLSEIGPTTVQEFQLKFGILDPRARVCELRWKFGHNIVTTRKKVRDRFGNLRVVGEYALLKGNWESKNVQN